MAFLTSDKIPPVSREFIDAMKKAFRPPVIRPGFDRDQAIAAAAKQEVIEWVERYARTKVLSGDAEDLEKPEAPQPWWRRMFKWVRR